MSPMFVYTSTIAQRPKDISYWFPHPRIHTVCNMFPLAGLVLITSTYLGLWDTTIVFKIKETIISGLCQQTCSCWMMKYPAICRGTYRLTLIEELDPAQIHMNLEVDPILIEPHVWPSLWLICQLCFARDT